MGDFDRAKAKPGRWSDRLGFMLLLVGALLAAGDRWAVLGAWKQHPDRYFVPGIPVVSTADPH